ncbi:TIGR02710 family CRISPR-associated CARF protein [uncultured Methanobrevibacter sp.]|uniref:TIGR02710 family CRISPR-associated CARF protein n=1 Tax=uncultured Methanobrevibacter sp. TaxID=253161 RepID=UPI0026377B43
MARKKIGLFMTVGTGFGEDGPRKLANGLFASIQKAHPDFIVFFVSENSLETIDFIKKLAIEDSYDEFIEGEDYKLVSLKNIDGLSLCFKQMESEILEYENDYRILVDYTSGTKTMAVAMAVSAAFYNKEIFSVSGNRKGGIVTSGTETIKSQNLYFIYDRMRINKLKEYFNNNRFDIGLQSIEEIIDPEFEKDKVSSLFKAYSYWDNVNFEESYNIMKDLDASYIFFKPLAKQIKINKIALGNILRSNSKNLKLCYILASLLNNAKRRYEEHKYDDAIARLYRSLELIGQISLEKYGLDSSDIDVGILEEKGVSKEFIGELEKMRTDGKIKIGLIKDLNLLYEMGNGIGRYYKENENRINNLTKKRNDSILAHGLESQSKEDYEQFEKIVIDLALKMDRDMKKFLKETSFPKF